MSCFILLLSSCLALGAASTSEVKLRLDLTSTHPVSKDLYGIFFEEVSLEKGPEDLPRQKQ